MHRKIMVVTINNDGEEVDNSLFRYNFDNYKSEHIIKTKDEWLKDEISYFFREYKNCSDDLIILNTKKELLMRDPLNKREEIEETNKQISNLETKLRDIQHLMKTPDYINILKRSFIYDGYSFDSQENLMEYYNENGKFDYYDIGGRWQNTLKKENEYGKVSLCNCCKIDKLHMYQTDEEKEFLTRKWNFIVNDIDDGIDFENKDDCKVNKEYIKNAFLRDYGTLETYIDSSIIDPPTAMVTSLEEWLEFEELDAKDACEKFLEALKDENPEYYIYIVDIHE